MQTLLDRQRIDMACVVLEYKNADTVKLKKYRHDLCWTIQNADTVEQTKDRHVLCWKIKMLTLFEAT